MNGAKRQATENNGTPASCISNNNNNNNNQNVIFVVVVESHQHALEHIHSILRKKRLLTHEWSMLHFDAHPDLACPSPSIPAKACFLPYETFPSSIVDAPPDNNSSSNNNNDNDNEKCHQEGEQPIEKNLYELLDSTATGIAEWILPLVLAANLRTVHWIKPSTEAADGPNQDDVPRPPSQLPCGIHDYHVGVSIPLLPKNSSTDSSSSSSSGNGEQHQDDTQAAAVTSFMDLPPTATVKVDWPHPYYLEDNCTVHFGGTETREFFALPQPFRLEVSELGNNNNNEANDNNIDDCDSIIAPPKHHKASQLGGSLSSTTATNATTETTTSTVHITSDDLWELDICLDYFACQNPFLTDLETLDPVFTNALLKAAFQSRFYSPAIMSTPAPGRAQAAAATTTTTTSSQDSNNQCYNRQQELLDTSLLKQYRQDLRTFWKFLIDLLERQLQLQTNNNQSVDNDDDNIMMSKNIIVDYYADPDKGKAYLKELIEAFRGHVGQSKSDNNNDAANIKLARALISMTEQALPNLMMPHHRWTNSVPDTEKMTDQREASTDETAQSVSMNMNKIRPVLQRVQRGIERRYQATSAAENPCNGMAVNVSSNVNAPYMITIARSSNDGFTPCTIVDALQDSLIQGLHSFYCGCPENVTRPNDEHEREECSRCRFRIVFDYGLWEGTTLFS